jgi:hypothetical protein
MAKMPKSPFPIQFPPHILAQVQHGLSLPVVHQQHILAMQRLPLGQEVEH